MVATNDTNALPDGLLPCIWMLAGLVAYRLCDRDCECDGCPFDTAMSGPRPVPRIVPMPAARRHDLDFPPDRSYSPTHAWVEKVDGGRLRVGLDRFAAGLLDRISAVILPAEGSSLQRGRPACWVVDDALVVPFRAPLSGTITRVNQAVRGDPSLVLRSPYGDGWLLEVESEQNPAAMPDLRGADEHQRETLERVAELRERVMRQVARRPEVGPTAADGGELAADIRIVLGPVRYHRLVRRLLG